MPTEETLEEKLNYILPGVTETGQVPPWPPDIFCLCAVILHYSGAYTAVVDDRQAYLAGATSSERALFLNKVGDEWRKSLQLPRKLPKEIQQWWQALLSEKGLPLSRI